MSALLQLVFARHTYYANSTLRRIATFLSLLESNKSIKWTPSTRFYLTPHWWHHHVLSSHGCLAKLFIYSKEQCVSVLAWQLFIVMAKKMNVLQCYRMVFNFEEPSLEDALNVINNCFFKVKQFSLVNENKALYVIDKWYCITKTK